LLAESVFAVSESQAHAAPEVRHALVALAQSRGGQLVEERNLASLRPALLAALQPERAPAVVHPMRSAWWIVPFVLLLAFAWLSAGTPVPDTGVPRTYI
jgi:hypothetical protein